MHLYDAVWLFMSYICVFLAPSLYRSSSNVVYLNGISRPKEQENETLLMYENIKKRNENKHETVFD